MGYLKEKQKIKKTSKLILFSAVILSILTFSGLIINNDIINFLDEFRLQYLFITFFFFGFSLLRRRFYASLIFTFLIIVNFFVVTAQNQILVKEYAGKNPFIFKTLVHRMDDDNKDFSQLAKLIETEDPNIAVVFSSKDNIDNRFNNYNYNIQESIDNGDFIQVLSKYPYSEKIAINDSTGKKIGYLLHFSTLKRPISIVVTTLSPRSEFKENQDIKTLQSILAVINTRNEPVMIIGGFNYNPWSNIFSGLRDIAFKTQAGLTPDFPSYLPYPLRLSSNYIYTLPGLSIFETEILEKTSSNYIPLLHTIAIESKK